jgi:hypothetical protein
VNWPEVRISRDGEWLLCISVSCGERLARFEVSSASGEVEPHLGPGWVRSGPEGWLDPGSVGLGIWHMSKRARDRHLRGKAPLFRRRPPDRDGFVNDPKVMGGRGYDRPENLTILLGPLPTLIVCPRCDRTQVVPNDVYSASQRSATIRPTEPGIRSG